MVDIHCHILPEVDDGADSWQVAIEMCRLAAADGISHIVATPHANDEYDYDRERHSHAVAQLNAEVHRQPEISLGCDFRFSYENVRAVLQNPANYTIDNTSYLLLELSDYGIPPVFLQTLRQFRTVGLRPIITHPERNPLLQGRPQQVLQWAQLGVIIQVTANSLTGYWGKTPQRVARWLLEHHAVHVLATDAHDPNRRPPLLSAAREKLVEWQSDEVARALVDDNPAAIIRGEDLPYFPSPNYEVPE